MVDDVPAHWQKKTVTEDIYYPEHDHRTASKLYIRNHNLLVHHYKFPCWICGVTEMLETHHWNEEAEANNLDLKKVHSGLFMLDAYGFTKQMGIEPLTSLDDIRNLVVLCQDHHRHKEKGIHCLTFPIWLAQRAVLPGHIITKVGP